jgi:outer membrane receptor protein involved in Fe transport
MMPKNVCKRAAITMFVAFVVLGTGSMCLLGQATNAIISGTVTDATGAAVPGAAVQVRNLSTGVLRTATSNNQGRYNVPDLLVGEYEAQVSKTGFETMVQRGITLSVGSDREIDFSLRVGQTQTTVAVEAQTPLVETTSAALTSLVEQKQIADLPLNGRNYTELIALAPGVQQTASGFPSGFYGRGADYSISGARPEGQAFLLDNSNVQDFWNHGPGSAVLGTTLGVEAIAEFSVQSNTYSAQFGGAGAAINAVTRSGTNQLHGSAFEYLRNSALDARAFYDPRDLPSFKQNQFGASLGGPIRKDKAFYFFNYEGLRRRQGQTFIATVPDANARNGILPGSDPIILSPLTQQLLSYYPLPTSQTLKQAGAGVGQFQSVATQAGDEDYLIGRADYTLSNKDSLFARYVNDRAMFHDPFSGGPITQWPETHHTGNHYATIEERRIISSSVVNLVRAGFVRTKEGSDLENNLAGLSFYPNRKNGTLNIAGLSPLGSSIFLPFSFVQNKFSGGDDVFWTQGNHSLKFGGVVERVQSNVDAPGWLGGQYNFNSLSDFLNNRAFLFFGPLPSLSDGNRDFREVDVTGYAQDDWRVNKRLTLNIGLRYEFVTNPTTDKHPLNAITDYLHATAFTTVPNVFKNNPSDRNLDPRFGFAYDPFDDHKTSIRGGFGIFHNPIAPRTYASAYYFNPPYSFLVLLFPSFPSPAFPGIPLPSQSNAVNYDTPTTPYQMQWNLNIQRELMSNTVLTVGYAASRGVHLFYQRDQNPPIPTTGADGRRVFSSLGPFGPATNPRVNPAMGPYNGAEAAANSAYQSLQINLNHRFQHHLQAQAAYTLSHCIDNSSNTYGLEGGAPAQDPYNAASDRGNCLFDRRHSLTLNALFDVPLKGHFAGHQLIEGWQLGGILTVRSGGPINITDGFDYPALGAAFVAPRPDLKPGRNAGNIITGTLNQWFDPTAFALPPPGELGNAGRDLLVGPNTRSLNFSAHKDIPLTEQVHAQFRAEFFNVTNHPNWGNPNAGVFVQGGSPNAIAGQITTVRVPMRQTQFALRFIF